MYIQKHYITVQHIFDLHIRSLSTSSGNGRMAGVALRGHRNGFCCVCGCTETIEGGIVSVPSSLSDAMSSTSRVLLTFVSCGVSNDVDGLADAEFSLTIVSAGGETQVNAGD
jgi:hypothetical protein